MNRWIAISGVFLFLLAASAGLAQDSVSTDFRLLGVATLRASTNDSPVLDERGLSDAAPGFDVTVPTALPRMSPDLALVTYLSLAYRQLTELGAYSDATIIEATLPDTAQHGKYELRRMYQAPHTLAFAAIQFAGDSFVKTNIIARLLQSEVDHVQKGEGALTAINGDNYKFNWKGTEVLDGRVVYIYQVRPKHKRLGLFKGRILVDATTGRLRRAEGTMVKSPSLFVKKLEFVQDYGDFGSFSLPVHVHSVAKTRLVGRAVVDIYHERYQAKTMVEVQSESGASSSAAAGSGSSSNN